MQTMETYEFAGPDWVAAIGRMIHDGAAGQDLSGVDYSMCEVFTDAPPHLCAEGETTVGWYLRIRDGAVEVAPGRLDDATFLVTGDYATVLPLARSVMAGNPAAAALAGEAVATGRLRVVGDRTTAPAFLAMLDL